MYTVAQPDEYLAITGMGIKTVLITKSTWVWPFQRCRRFSVQPHDYGMDLQAMTKEKLQFLLPVVFTIGPDVNARGANSKGGGAAAAAQDAPGSQQNAVNAEDRGDALMKYAMLLADAGGNQNGANGHSLEQIVKGIIEGETRVLVSSMTMEEIFTEREEFKRKTFKNIQSELDQFGLKIYNANVKELKDAVGSTYFRSLSQKAHEGATNQARIDVADAQLKGNVGEADRHGKQQQAIAAISAGTAIEKTKRDIERTEAEAKLETERTKYTQAVDIAKIQAQRATQSRDEELKKEVELKRAGAELERLRATDLVKATIARESKQQAADARAYEVEAEARANLEKSNKTTDAQAYKIKVDTEAQALADFSRMQKAADAAAYKTQVETEADYNRVAKNTDAAAYKTKVQTEAQAQSAFNLKTKNADADAYETQKNAEAGAQATLQNAEAGLQQMLKEAEGLKAKAEAYASMSQALGGPSGLLQYLMIENGTYVELAKANAEAIRGLQPKISVWNTGADAGTGQEGGRPDATSSIRSVYQMLPPLMTTINEQTGITLPEWQFGRMAGEMSSGVDKNVARVNGKKG